MSGRFYDMLQLQNKYSLSGNRFGNRSVNIGGLFVRFNSFRYSQIDTIGQVSFEGRNEKSPDRLIKIKKGSIA